MTDAQPTACDTLTAAIEERSHLPADFDLDAAAHAATVSLATGLPLTVNPADVLALTREVRRLRVHSAAWVDLLAESVFREAQATDPILKYPLVCLDDTGDGYYLPWSGSCDAPVDYRYTRQQALDRGWMPHHLDTARRPDPETGFFFNRGGPRERPLTVDALKEAWESPETHAAFRLTPDKVACATTQDIAPDGKGGWKTGDVYWSPWHPDDTPDELPDGWPDRF